MFKYASHQGIANQKHNEIPCQTPHDSYNKKRQIIISVDTDVEIWNRYGGNIKWYIYFGKGPDVPKKIKHIVNT